MRRLLEEQYDEVLKENVALIEQNKKLLVKLEQAEDALKTAYSYIEQTDQELNKRHLLKALKQLRED